jgi:hypothetical protein
MDELLCARETAFRRDRKLKARTRTAANCSDCAIRAKHHPKPDLNEFSASPVNTSAYFVSDQGDFSCSNTDEMPPRQRQECLHVGMKEATRIIISRDESTTLTHRDAANWLNGVI